MKLEELYNKKYDELLFDLNEFYIQNYSLNLGSRSQIFLALGL